MDAVASSLNTVEFELPVPPSANKWWRMVTPKGKPSRMVLSADARLYKEGVGTLLRGQFRGRPVPLFPSGVVRLWLDWHRTARLGDLDKRQGVLLDALQGVVYDNDSQLVELHAVLHEAAVKDYVHVRVTADAVQERLL